MGYRKLLVGAVTAVMLVFLIGAAYRMYEQYTLAPERVISRAFGNMLDEQSWEYSGDINMGFISYRYSGASGNMEGEEGKGWFRVNMKLGATVSQGLEFRLIDDSIYYRPGPSTNTFIGESAPAQDWVKIGYADVKERAEKPEERPSWFYFGLTANTEKNAEERNAKQKFLRDIVIFETIEELKPTKLHGVESRHYSFVLNKDQLKDLMIAFRDIEEKPYDESELEELDQLLDIGESWSGEVWIGKKDELPYKIVIKTEAVESDMVGKVIPVSPDEMTPEGIADVSASGRKAVTPAPAPRLQLTLSLKNFGKPVKTSVPKHTDATSVEAEQVTRLFFPPQYQPRSEEETRKASEEMKKQIEESMLKMQK